MHWRAMTADNPDDAIGKTGPEHRLTSERLRHWGMFTHIDHVFDLVPFWRQAVDAAERGEELRLEEFLDKMEEGGGWRTTNDVWNLLGARQKTPRSVSDATQMCWDEQDQGWGIQEEWGMAKHGSEERCIAEDKGWGTAEPWAMAEHNSDEWGITGAWPPEQESQPHVGVSEDLRVGDDVGEFVDEIARRRAASEEHRRQMHRFFQVRSDCSLLFGPLTSYCFQMPTEQKVQAIQAIIKFLRTHH